MLNFCYVYKGKERLIAALIHLVNVIVYQIHGRRAGCRGFYPSRSLFLFVANLWPTENDRDINFNTHTSHDHIQKYFLVLSKKTSRAAGSNNRHITWIDAFILLLFSFCESICFNIILFAVSILIKGNIIINCNIDYYNY